MADVYQKMTVIVDGKEEQRRIVAIETNRDMAMDVLGIAAFNLPVTALYPIPETFEGERIERGVDGTVYIVRWSDETDPISPGE